MYNAAAFIGDTLRSILAQDVAGLEVVVVDDASTDRSCAVVDAIGDPRLRLVRNPQNQGAATTWNRALSEVGGRYVKLVCHDDTLAPGALAAQVAALEAHPEVALVAGRRDIVDEDGRTLLRARGLAGLAGVVPGRQAIRATVRSGTNIFGEPAAVMTRRELISRCGPFSSARPYVIDLDYWCRMLRLGDLYAADRTVASFRVVQTSWSVALAARQGAEVVSLFEALRSADPDSITKMDLRAGALRARALMWSRGASYRVLRARSRERSNAQVSG